MTTPRTGAEGPRLITGDEQDLSPYMTQEPEENTAMRRTDSGGAKVRNLELIDGLLVARNIPYTWPAERLDGLFLKHTLDGVLEWAEAEGPPGIQGPPGPAPPSTTSLPFNAITGTGVKGQLPPEIAYEDEVNTFTLAQNMADLRAPEFEALMRQRAG